MVAILLYFFLFFSVQLDSPRLSGQPSFSCVIYYCKSLCIFPYLCMKMKNNLSILYLVSDCWMGGLVLNRLSTSLDHIADCKSDSGCVQGVCGVQVWWIKLELPLLYWVEWSMPGTVFQCQLTHQFNYSTGDEQKGITHTILHDSEPAI